MRLYYQYFKLRIITMLQYREAAIAGLTTQFFWGLMLVFIYTALYQNGNNVGITLTEMVTYVWLNQAFFALLNVRNVDNEISDTIKNGDVAYEIIKPYNLYLWWYIKNMAKRIANGMLRFMPVIIIAIILPAPYGISPPDSLTSFILFIISLFLGILVVTGINMLVYIVGFYTYNEEGIKSMLNSIMEFLSGAYMPVVLLPTIIQKSTYYLPFRLISDFPYRVYSNNIGIKEGILSISLQLIWIFILVLIGNLIVKKALKKVFIQGG